MGEYPTIPKEEYLERMKRAREEAAKQGFDALLVISRGGGTFFGHENVFYLTGHYPTFPVCLPPEMGRGHAALLLPVGGEPTLMVDTNYFRKEWVAVSDVSVCPDLYTGVIESVKSSGLGQSRLGLVGSGVVSLAVKQRLDSGLPKVSWGFADEIVEKARMIKSQNEIEVIRRVGKVASAVGNTFLGILQEGITEADVAAELGKVMLENGADVYGYYLTTDWQPIRWPLVAPDQPRS
jgi:Xaa-Pro aminopeptidase